MKSACWPIVALLLGCVTNTCRGEAGGSKIYEVKTPPVGGANSHYVSNRPPLLPSPLVKLPVGSITPKGWLRRQLELMAEGMVGHMSELSPRVRPDSGWLNPEGFGDEWVPYWLKGYVSLGYALDDGRIMRDADKWLKGIMAAQAENGFFGPKSNHYGPRGVGRKHLWPQMLVMFAAQTQYEATGDERILDFMTKYFRFQMSIPPEDLFEGVKWMRIRGGDNLESIYWLYNRTGEEWLLELAERVHGRTADWTGGVAFDPVCKEKMPQDYPLPSDHVVNVAMGYRQPGVYYQQSKDPKHIAAVERIYSLVWGEFGQVPGGMFGADERMRPGKIDPRQATETCSVVEFMYSNESLLRITGEVKYADRCEDAALNTYPATMTPELKAIRYLTAPNLPQADAGSKPCFRNQGKMVAYSPGSEYHCCQHNHGQGWPYYAEHLWLATCRNGLAAVLYAPCTVEATVGDGTKVKIDQQTEYPFGQSVDLVISTPQAVSFPLMLRIPGWCKAAKVWLGGEIQGITPSPSSYVVIERTWHDGDKVHLELPAQITLSVWEKNKNAVSVNRGPLTYSLKIGEDWARSGGSDKWPQWEVFPKTPWNYGLIVDRDNPSSSFKVVTREAVPDQPFTPDAAPIELHGQGKQIPNWTMVDNCPGELQPSPVKSGEPVEEITLIPMGCARLRMSALPVIGEGPDVHQWVGLWRRHGASHCFKNDTAEAMSDGKLPKSSGDRGIPHFSWWPHLGTSEWVAYGFRKPRRVSQVEVYWYDDRSHGGHCRVPQSWRVEWLDGRTWKPVAGAGDCGVQRDKFNRVTFDPVTTPQIRLAVRLQPEFSGGVLEWRIE